MSWSLNWHRSVSRRPWRSAPQAEGTEGTKAGQLGSQKSCGASAGSGKGSAHVPRIVVVLKAEGVIEHSFRGWPELCLRKIPCRWNLGQDPCKALGILERQRCPGGWSPSQVEPLPGGARPNLLQRLLRLVRTQEQSFGNRRSQSSRLSQQGFPENSHSSSSLNACFTHL